MIHSKWSSFELALVLFVNNFLLEKSLHSFKIFYSFGNWNAEMNNCILIFINITMLHSKRSSFELALVFFSFVNNFFVGDKKFCIVI